MSKPKYILIELWDRVVTKTDNDKLAKLCGDASNYLVINMETGEARSEGKVVEIAEDKSKPEDTFPKFVK